jgi:hypothetical protein
LEYVIKPASLLFATIRKYFGGIYNNGAYILCGEKFCRLSGSGIFTRFFQCLF